MPITPACTSPRATNLPAKFLLLFVLSVSLIALLPRPSHAISLPAIPVAGDYVFTSGLTGTFTSDGTRLTAWTITGSYGVTFIGNNPNDASQSGPSFLDSLVSLDPGTHTIPSTFFLGITYLTVGSSLINTVAYLEDWGNFVHGSAGHIRQGTATYTRVPEPSSTLLAGLGLLLLLGYGWRQRRHPGPQIG